MNNATQKAFDFFQQYSDLDTGFWMYQNEHQVMKRVQVGTSEGSFASYEMWPDHEKTTPFAVLLSQWLGKTYPVSQSELDKIQIVELVDAILKAANEGDDSDLAEAE